MTKTMNENVIGSRIAAMLIDLIVWGLIFTIFSVLVGQTDTSNGINIQLSGLPFAVYSLLWFMYYVGMEASLGGTVGKLMLGLTVVNDEGNRISISQSFTRNALRIIDAFPYFLPYIVGLVSVASSPTKQRVGDRAARTYVVKP